MPLRVARPERRWKRSCGGNLIPEPVWCEERRHPAGHCAGGVHLAADTRPGVAVTGCLVCTQPCLRDAVVVRTSLSVGSSPGSRPLALKKSLDFHLLRVLCSVRLRPEHGEQDISPRYPTCSHHPTVREDRAFCQRFRPWTQKARPFQQPHTHSCSSRWFLTVPRHHSA